MMSTESFRESQGRPGQNQSKEQFVTTNSSAPTPNEPLYYQMSRMQTPANPSSTASFVTSAQQSNTSSLPFFSTAQGGSHYSSPMAAPKGEYSGQQPRAISDEMMRHILLSANSLPSTASVPHSQSLSQMRGPLQPSQQPVGSYLKQDDKGRKGKGKGARALAPGEKPVRKKKRRAFEFYWEELRSEYARTHSHLGHNERRAIAQAEWKNVTDREKWQKMADDYNEKMLDEKYKHRPKPPVTANAFFFKEHHVLLRQQRPELKGGAVLAEISKMWERCTDRTRWTDMQAEDRRRYESEMAQYKASQVAQGHML